MTILPRAPGANWRGKPQTTSRLQGELAAPSIDESLALRLLPFVLSTIAGSCDVIGFLASAFCSPPASQAISLS